MKPTFIASISLITLLAIHSVGTTEPSSPFPRPAELEPDIGFWTHIFTAVDTRHGVIHDARHLNVVYETIPVPQGLSRRSREKRIKRVKARYKKILLRLAKGKRNKLKPEEQRVLDLWPENVSNKTLRLAAKRLRFQLGQSDKFRDGWIRSGSWRPFIENTLAKHGVPQELASLPHVESSFNPKAYSRVGAAGLWQFTRSTGRRYMRIDHVVDERMDPFKATEAAARLLKHNHSVTGTWPLAITAYNHGAAGMRRAARKLGTTDIAPILRHYKSRTFGFASRNFYVALLAAIDVDRNAEKYFGPLKPRPTDQSVIVKAPAYITPETAARHLGVERSELKDSNPALRPLVWKGNKYIPRGFELRVSCTQNCERIADALTQISATERHSAQKRDLFHKVRRGQTLSTIAARYRIPVQELVHLNNLRSRNLIRVGQVLRLPQPRDRKSKPTMVASVESAIPVDGLYRVQRGDSVSRIARRFGLQEHDILTLNQLSNKNKIYPGQELRVAMHVSPTADMPTEVPTPVEEQPSKLEVEAVAESEINGETIPLTEPESESQSEESVKSSETDDLTEVASVEPAIPNDTEPLGSTLPSELHPALSADPSDYTVASDGTIEVQAAETLGHYADWLNLPTQRLRNLNRLRFGKPVMVGMRLKLDFSKLSPDAFEERRVAHHRRVQGAFFEKYRITGTVEHVLKRGESLWILTHRKFSVPVWLLRQYNPDLNVNQVWAGIKITFPRVELRHEAEPSDASPVPPAKSAHTKKTAPWQSSATL